MRFLDHLDSVMIQSSWLYLSAYTVSLAALACSFKAFSLMGCFLLVKVSNLVSRLTRQNVSQTAWTKWHRTWRAKAWLRAILSSIHFLEKGAGLANQFYWLGLFPRLITAYTYNNYNQVCICWFSWPAGFVTTSKWAIKSKWLTYIIHSASYIFPNKPWH